MTNLTAMIWVELRKAGRSRAPLATGLGFLLLPLVGAFLMFIYKDPEFARQNGLISTKANLVAATADWPTYLGFLAQGTAVGGMFVFSLVCSWVFGREFADGTAKDLLAVPVARVSILLAKFVVVLIWSVALALEALIAGIALGALLDLPAGSVTVFAGGVGRLAITVLLVIAVALPSSFFASAGRGYLPPIGFALVAVLFANVIAIIGWGSLFPWSVPALYSGMGGQAADLTGASYWLVILTGMAGIAATCAWWQVADQNR